MVSNDQPRLERRAAVAQLVASVPESLIVTGLGSPTYDVHAAGDDDRNYYLWGAMGGAALVGLGIALAQPDRRVLVITGDGEQLMAIGGLTTIAVAKPDNLDIVVLDNERYGETGMQESHTARGADLAALAATSGFVDTAVINTPAGLDDLLAGALAQPASGPRLFVIKISDESPPRSMPSRDAVFIKNRFRANLDLAPN